MGDLSFQIQYNPLYDSKGKLSGVTGVAVDVTEHQRMEDALRHSIEFEKLIFQLSSHFINLPLEKIDIGIQNSVDSIARFIGADRSMLFLTKGDRIEHPTYLWASSVENEGKAWNSDTFLSDYPWFTEKLQRYKSFT